MLITPLPPSHVPTKIPLPRVEMGLDPAHLEVTENPVITSQIAGAFPMLAWGHASALFPCYVYLRIQLLLNQCRCSRSKAVAWQGRARGLGRGTQRLHRWKGGRRQRRVEELPLRTLTGEWRLGTHQQGLQTAPQLPASHRCSWTVCST